MSSHWEHLYKVTIATTTIQSCHGTKYLVITLPLVRLVTILCAEYTHIYAHQLFPCWAWETLHVLLECRGTLKYNGTHP